MHEGAAAPSYVIRSGGVYGARGCEKTKTKYCGGNHSLAYKERFPRNTSKKAVWIGQEQTIYLHLR